MRHHDVNRHAGDVHPDTLAQLRAATNAEHERIDAAFSALSLGRRDGLERFLKTHAIGLNPLFPIFAEFVEHRLEMPCPDFPAMLNDDLRALGVDTRALPHLQPPSCLSDRDGAPGVGYVVCGSRLGLEVIRRAGYWDDGGAFRSRYMEDERGRACWKALVPWLNNTSMKSSELQAIRASALASFETFAQAIAASAGEKTDRLGANG